MKMNLVSACAQRLHAILDVAALLSAMVAEAVQLTGADFAVFLQQEDERLGLKACAAGSQELGAALLEAHAQGRLSALELLAGRALSAGNVVSAPAAGAMGEMGGLSGDAILLAAPVVTERTRGVLLLGQKEGELDGALVRTLAGYAGLALAHAELHAASAGQARELQEHRQRAANLVGLALELGSSLSLPDFIRSFTARAADMLGARAAAVGLARGPQLETVFVHDPAAGLDGPLLRRMSEALSEFAANHPEPIHFASCESPAGRGLSIALGWKDVTLARLAGANNELLGVLCLADRGQPLSPEDHNLLQALAGHASVTLENARLFSRIAQSSKQWAEIFDSITDFIVVHGEENRVLRANRSLAEFIGERPSELVGMSMRALISSGPDSGGQPCPFCRPGLRTDEYIHPVLGRTYLVSTSQILGALNEGMQTVHVLKDITDRREAERRYRELFDNIQEGVFFASPEGRFIEVNDALVRMLGYDSREELLEIDIAGQLYTSAERLQQFYRSTEEQGMVRNYEETLRRKNGGLIHTLQNAFVVRDGQGKVAQYRGVILDITEAKNFQAQLQRERDFSSKILNQTQSMILVADTAGQISYANRRWFEAAGYRQQELLGHSLLEIAAPSYRQAMEEALRANLRGQPVDNLELVIRRGDGSVGRYSANLSPMRNEQGEITSLVAVMTDITDAAILQAKMMHTEKMAAVGQLVSGVAHEVNNPLTAILGLADLMLENPALPESAHGDLRVMVQEAQRTKAIVQNLLSFARQVPPQRQPVQLNEVLRRTIALRAYDFSGPAVQVEERLDGALPETVGDAHQLQQVFLNILNNAYDAVRETGRRGHIIISTCQRDGFAEVSFEDNGEGIKFPERIFDPFFTTKEVGKGTGLGLSICYGLVHEHGGEISCFNHPDRPGATFRVRLPLAGQAAAARGAR